MLKIEGNDAKEMFDLQEKIKQAFPSIYVPYPQILDIVIIEDYNQKNLSIMEKIKNDPLVSHLKVEAWELTPI